jgi:hypothetical protein
VAFTSTRAELPDSLKGSSEKSLWRRRHGRNLGLLRAKRAGVVGKSQMPDWVLSGRAVQCSRWRGTQAVRERSAKPLCVGSIPTRASIFTVRNSSHNQDQCPQFKRQILAVVAQPAAEHSPSSGRRRTPAFREGSESSHPRCRFHLYVDPAAFIDTRPLQRPYRCWLCQQWGPG